MSILTNNKGIPNKCVECAEVSNCFGHMSCPEICKALEKLKHYEDLEEQGRLIEIPCKVGDTVWELRKCDDEVYRIFPMEVKQVVPYGSVMWIKMTDPVIWHIYAESSQTYTYKNFYDFEKTIFVTKEEAEKKLKEMEKCRILVGELLFYPQ